MVHQIFSHSKTEISINQSLPMQEQPLLPWNQFVLDHLQGKHTRPLVWRPNTACLLSYHLTKDL